jgi:hypothetical protein
MRFEFEFRIVLFYFSFIFILFGESCFLSSGVQVAGAACCTATRIVTGVGDLVQRTGDGRTCRVLSGQEIERSGDVVCSLHHACGDEERGFLG